MQLDTQLKSEDFFDYLGKESEQTPDKEIELEHNESLEEIINGFDRLIEDTTGVNTHLNLAQGYGPETCSASDIEKFSLWLNRYHDLRGDIPNIAGLYLTALCNKAKEDEITIHTKHLKFLVDNLGEENERKTINVDGNCGNFIGKEMYGGTINVFGNVENGVAYSMFGGRINVYGNANNTAGYGIGGGELHIHGDAQTSLGINIGCTHLSLHSVSKGDGKIYLYGDAGDNVGVLRECGEIHLLGNFKSISPRISQYGLNYRSKVNPLYAKIFHKGRLIQIDDEEVN